MKKMGKNLMGLPLEDSIENKNKAINTVYLGYICVERSVKFYNFLIRSVQKMDILHTKSILIYGKNNLQPYPLIRSYRHRKNP